MSGQGREADAARCGAAQGQRSGAGGGRVVVGVSGSPASLAALRAAAEQARRGGPGRVLVAVLAWEPPEGEALYARHPDPEWARHWWDAARARLDRAFDAAFGGTPPGVTVERRVVRSRPGPALCELASGPDDLLVLGARAGRRGTGQAQRYVRTHASCAVLTVPAPRAPKGFRRTLRRMTPEDFALASH